MMAVSFQIGGSTMPLDPEVVRWSQPEWLGRAHGGIPLVNAKRSVSLRWDVMSAADYDTLETQCNAAAHSIKVPHPNSGTYTTFTTSYLRIDGERRDINVYSVELTADFITVA
jgi:hypothetical protein